MPLTTMWNCQTMAALHRQLQSGLAARITLADGRLQSGFFTSVAWQAQWAGRVGGLRPCRFQSTGPPTCTVPLTPLGGGVAD